MTVSNMAVQNQRRGDTMSSVKGLSDDAVLQAKVAKNMAPMSDDGQPTPAPDATPPTRKLAMPGKESDPTPDDSGSVKSDPLVPAAKADEPKADDGPPAIPENYIAAAKHQGISDEDVAKMYETNPQGTVDYLKNIYESTNKLSQSFATLGRREQAIKVKAAEAAAQPVKAPEFDMSKLNGQYEADDPLVVMLKEQHAQIHELTTRKVAEPAPDQNLDAATVSTIDSFFGADSMKPFQNFYGVVTSGDWQTLNAGEFAQREAVCEYAEAYTLGKAVQGERVPLDQALALAHLSISGGMREQAIRADIKGQIKKKASGVTLAPSGSAPAGEPGRNADGTKTTAQFEADTKMRLQRLSDGKPVRG